jgi:putative peptide zinc metalloprotease protein
MVVPVHVRHGDGRNTSGYPHIQVKGRPMASSAAQVPTGTGQGSLLARPDAQGTVDDVSTSKAISASFAPALAPEVVLLGEMPDTGFTDRMWLVQLDGRFIQLTELLYRVVEQCDSSRSLAHIAENVSATTEWQMNADDAEYLLVKKLIPTGIVLSPEATEDQARHPGTAPSLLRLGLRRGVISADAIEPVAKRLQWLFLPALLIPLVTIGLVAHAWLYLDRGVSGLLSNVLNTPGLLVLVFLMSIAPGFWHEFGHASALRYGGGRARSIGVGIYIMDPAFYTDVTDSYRLPRWARVRTGFGGIYFDFLLSTALMGAYFMTGQEVLLLLVVLSNINTAYQFFPLVRLDGYWILADLSGVPDFYSMMGGFVRSVVPIPAWKGAKLPPLRRWVKGVFAVYTLIGLPGMLIFLLLLIRRLPSLYERTWNALAGQAEAVPESWRQADWMLLAAQVSQILLLSVAMIGMAWFIFVMVRTYGTLLWKLGRHLFRRWRPATQLA